MQVQKIQNNNYNTNFKSRVYITNYGTEQAMMMATSRTEAGVAQDLFNSKRFLNSIQALERNGNNDTVVFGVEDHGFVYMSVKDGDKISSKKVYIKNPFDPSATDDRNYKFKSVSEAYKECKIDAIENSFDAEIPAHLDKYVIC